MKKWNSLLTDAIEMHAHSSPSIFERRQNDWELLEDVNAAGMNGIVLKSHESTTFDRAELLQIKYPELNIFGGIVCNLFTGGLSKNSVNMALEMGAKIVWMPTLSALQHKKYFSQNIKRSIFKTSKTVDDFSEGLTVINTQNEVKDNVKEILTLIAEYDAVLATGHLNHSEVLLLVEEAKRIGVEKILIQHADLGIAAIPLEEQVHLAQKGCYIEKCYLACGQDFNNLSIRDLADSILEIGDNHCVLVTDYGQAHNIPVINALEQFIEKLVEEGIPESSINKMVSENPKFLLNI